MVRTWRAPVTFDAPTTAAMLRDGLDALGYRYSKKQGERSFGDTVDLDMHRKGTTAWRFFVEHPGRFVLETYDTRPRRGSVLAFLEVHGIVDEDEPSLRKLLRRFVDQAPKPPWTFGYVQRMQIGPFSGAYRDARRAWKPVAADEPLDLEAVR